MAIYTVLAPKARDDGTLPDPMDVVFVKEGFSWPALFFAVPWMLYRRLWLVLAGYIAVAVVLGMIGAKVGGTLAGDALILLHFLFALEANELRRWTLQRGGYALASVVEGRGLEEAEIHYFTALEAPAAAMPMPPVPPTPATPPMPPKNPGPLRPSAEAGDVVGLFPAPGAVA
jgi:Protein of unknown function (DUF2628)